MNKFKEKSIKFTGLIQLKLLSCKEFPNGCYKCNKECSNERWIRLKDLFEIIEEMKKEFPTPHLTRDWGDPDNNFQYWHIPSYKEMEAWFTEWFGDKDE